jgi:hypothetical protein
MLLLGRFRFIKNASWKRPFLARPTWWCMILQLTSNTVYIWCIKIFFFFSRLSHKFLALIRDGLFNSEFNSLSNDIKFIYKTNFWGEKISLLYSSILTYGCAWTTENLFFLVHENMSYQLDMIYSIQNWILHLLTRDSSLGHISEERNSLSNDPLCHHMWCIKIFFFFSCLSHKFVLSLRGGLFDSELKSLSNDVRFNEWTNFWREKLSFQWSSWDIICDAWRSFFSSLVFHISLSGH